RSRVVLLEAARSSLDAEPAGIPAAAVAADQVPEPPGDGGQRSLTLPGASVGPEDSGGIGPDRPAARHRLPEVLVVRELLDAPTGSLVDVVGQRDHIRGRRPRCP